MKRHIVVKMYGVCADLSGDICMYVCQYIDTCMQCGISSVVLSEKEGRAESHGERDKDFYRQTPPSKAFTDEILKTMYKGAAASPPFFRYFLFPFYLHSFTRSFLPFFHCLENECLLQLEEKRDK